MQVQAVQKSAPKMWKIRHKQKCKNCHVSTGFCVNLCRFQVVIVSKGLKGSSYYAFMWFFIEFHWFLVILNWCLDRPFFVPWWCQPYCIQQIFFSSFFLFYNHLHVCLHGYYYCESLTIKMIRCQMNIICWWLTNWFCTLDIPAIRNNTIELIVEYLYWWSKRIGKSKKIYYYYGGR